jgi:hypothetical protein
MFTGYSGSRVPTFCRLRLFQGRPRPATALRLQQEGTDGARHRGGHSETPGLQPETLPDEAVCLTLYHVTVGMSVKDSALSQQGRHQVLAHWSHSALQQTGQCSFLHRSFITLECVQLWKFIIPECLQLRGSMQILFSDFFSRPLWRPPSPGHLKRFISACTAME